MVWSLKYNDLFKEESCSKNIKFMENKECAFNLKTSNNHANDIDDK